MINIEIKGIFAIWYKVAAALGLASVIGSLIWSLSFGFEGIIAVGYLSFIILPLPISLIARFRK